MLAVVFSLIALLAYWLRAPSNPTSVFPSVVAMGAMLALVGFFVIRRMVKTTRALEQLVVSVSPDGLEMKTATGQFSLPANELRRITMYRTLLPPRLTFFVLSRERGEAAVPPLEDAEAFANELRERLPSVPFATKRKLIANFGA